jgi:hypothetical protein
MLRIGMFALLGALLVAPMAAAGPQAVVYYLADDSPVDGAGTMEAEAPTGNESTTGFVFAQIDGPTVVFASGAAETDRITGPAFLGLWTKGNAVVAGNITATLWLDDAGNRTLLASASQSAAIDPANAPDPTSLVPPDPTDPVASALHAAGKITPLMMKPPMLFEFGMLDVMIPANATLILGLGLTDGSGLGAGVSVIQFGAATTPSFTYIPWYIADPPAMTPAPSIPGASPSPASPTAPASPSGPSASPNGTESAPKEDSPGMGLIVLAFILTGVALRRRGRE